MANDSNVLVRLRLLGGGQFNQQVRGNARQLTLLERAGMGVNRSMRAMSTGATLFTATVTGAAVAVGKLGAETNRTQDEQMVGFTALLKSRAKAQKMVQDIRAMAVASPILDPKSTGDAVRTLLAYGITAKTVLPTVRALGDMSAASGRNFTEVMPLAAMALGQIQSKGRLQTQEMNQLAQSVGLSQKAIRLQLHMTQKEFADTFTPGNNISASKALPAIMRAMRQQSAGAADDLARTTAGRISQAKELMALAAGDFTRPFYNALGGLASRVSGVLGDLTAGKPGQSKVSRFANGLFGSGHMHSTRRHGLDRWTNEAAAPQMLGARIRRDVLSVLPLVSKLARGLATGGRELLGALKPAQPFLSNVLIPLLKGLAGGVLGSVVLAFKAVLFVLKPLMKGLGWIGEKLGPKAQSTFEKIGGVIGLVFGGGILKVLGLLGKLGVVFKLLAVPIRLFEGLINGVAWAMGKLVTGIWAVASPFRGALADAVIWVTEKFETFKKYADAILWPIRQAIKLGQALGLIHKNSAGHDQGTATTRRPAPRTSNRRQRQRNARQTAAQAADERSAFGDDTSPLAQARRNGVSHRSSIVIHLHNRTDLDGKKVHQSVVRHEERLAGARR